jgi:hypothetical protein
MLVKPKISTGARGTGAKKPSRAPRKTEQGTGTGVKGLPADEMRPWKYVLFVWEGSVGGSG